MGCEHTRRTRRLSPCGRGMNAARRMCEAGGVRAGRAVLLALAVCSAVPVHAQTPSGAPPRRTAEEAVAAVATAPVVVDGVTLFYVRGVSAYPAEQRAADIRRHIAELAADSSVAADSVAVAPSPDYDEIVAGSRRVMVVVDSDARLEGVGRATMARACAARVRSAIEAYRRDREPSRVTGAGARALGATVLLAALLAGVGWIHRRLRTRVEARYKARVKGVHIRTFQLVRSEQLWRVVTGILAIAWVGFALVAVYVYLQYVLTSFPWTRGLGLGLADTVAGPLRVFADGAISTFPKLVFLAILVFVTRYLLKVVRLFSDAIASGSVTLGSFAPEWAAPTYKLVRIMIIAFAVVIAYPYVPGAQTEAFKGVSLFIGVVFSLGSSSFIGNVIAGYSMTYRQTFHIGDRVKIGQHVGDVEAAGLMVTRLRTPKNEEVVVPNSQILGADVVNYSTMAKKGGLILHTTVGIGYETPWRQVNAMLLEAADRTAGLLAEPRPFVLQTALGDFAVTYEINVYCDTPALMPKLYTALHQNILDVFNEYGVQVMTPAYESDPEQPKVVPREAWYQAPARPE
jgi:small-conductance mechanosensitive channel